MKSFAEKYKCSKVDCYPLKTHLDAEELLYYAAQSGDQDFIREAVERVVNESSKLLFFNFNTGVVQ